MNTIDNTINWGFTLQWLWAGAALGALAIALVICWEIWRETR